MNIEAVDYGFWRLAFDVMQTLFMAGVALYTYLINRTKANRQAIEEMKTEQHQIAKKVALMERDITHLPSHNDLERLHEKVNVVANTLKTVEGELHGVNRNLTLILESLIGGRP